MYPTQAAPSSTPANELHSTLVDEDARIFDRYRAMFALRNKGGQEAVAALVEGFASKSALLKHELAYVLGQMQNTQAVSVLRWDSLHAAAVPCRHCMPAVCQWNHFGLMPREFAASTQVAV